MRAALQHCSGLHTVAEGNAEGRRTHFRELEAFGNVVAAVVLYATCDDVCDAGSGDYWFACPPRMSKLDTFPYVLFFARFLLGKNGRLWRCSD